MAKFKDFVGKKNNNNKQTTTTKVVYYYCLRTNENQESVVLFVLVFRLKGDAEYRVNGHRKVLYLDGTESWAETPAVDFRTTSFTLACWLKILPTGADAMPIYGDWSNPWQFRLRYVKAGQKISLQTRNNKGDGLLSNQTAGYVTCSAFFLTNVIPRGTNSSSK